MGQSEWDLMKKIGTYSKLGLIIFERQNEMPEIEVAKREMTCVHLDHSPSECPIKINGMRYDICC